MGFMQKLQSTLDSARKGEVSCVAGLQTLLQEAYNDVPAVATGVQGVISACEAILAAVTPAPSPPSP